MSNSAMSRREAEVVSEKPYLSEWEAEFLAAQGWALEDGQPLCKSCGAPMVRPEIAFSWWRCPGGHFVDIGTENSPLVTKGCESEGEV